MTDGFIRKKVESLTLGEKLIKLRSQYRMSLLEIAKATRIQAKYLQALESGDHRELPAEVYVRGFLRSYARYLGLQEDAFLKLYDKEKHIRTHLGKVEPDKKREKIVLGNVWLVTPRTLILTVVALVLLGTFGYLFRELRSFVAEPHLVISSPSSGLFTEAASVVVTGKTDRGARVTLNDEPVFVGTDGDFQEVVTLQPGSNRLRILSTNRFEKTKEVTVFVENTAQVVSADSSRVEVQSFDIELGTLGEVAEIRVVADGMVVWNGPWPSEKKERFLVQQTLEVTTSNPSQTTINLPDAPAKILDPENNQRATVMYTKDTLTSLTSSP